MLNSARIRIYEWRDREEIPEAPGVYAWFVPLYLYQDAHIDQQIEDVWRLLSYDPSQEGPKKTSFKIEFHWSEYQAEIEEVFRGGATDKMDQTLKVVLANQQKSVGFQKALIDASILLPPLYVGCAGVLRDRYKQHIAGANGNARQSGFGERFTEYVKARRDPKRSGSVNSLRVEDLLFVAIPFEQNTVELINSGDDLAQRQMSAYNLLEQIVEFRN
jgi:hypothetical protein